MSIIGFLGEKGGVGKTTNAHATAHGLCMLGIPAAYIMTDSKRELPSDEKRVYPVIDGRTVSKLEKAIATSQSLKTNGVYVIDGGGNRGAVDELLASICNTVILPFTADDDSVYVVDKELEQFPEAWAMPSDWATNSKAATVDAGYIEKLEARFPGRILPPTPTTHAIRDLVLVHFNGVLLPPAQRYCRTLARQILNLLGPAQVEQMAANVA